MKQQTTASEKRIVGKPFVKGKSGNPFGRAILTKQTQRLVDEMSRDFGGVAKLTNIQRTMLIQSARLFIKAERAKDPRDTVRLTNCAVRVLGNLRNGQRKHTPISLDEHLASVVAENGAA